MGIANIFGENPLTGLDEQFRIDPVSKCLVQVDLLHYLRHIGMYFQHNGKITALAAGANYDHLLITPSSASNKDCHLGVLSFDTDSSPCELFLYEEAVTSNNGVAQTPFNLNRNSSNVAATQIFHTPTVTSVGTQINYAISTGNKQNGGIGEGAFPEFILKRGTKYLIRITNSSTGAANLEYTMDWVEVPQPS